MLLDNVYREKKISCPLRYTWRIFYGDALAMVGFYGVITLLLLSLFGSLLAPYTLDQQFLGYQLLPPSWSHHGNVSFFLGTDDLGRDILSRLMDGTAATFGSALIATLAAAFFGMIIGVFAGVTHGLRSAALNYILDTLLSIPSLLLAIVVVAFIGPKLEHVILAVWLLTQLPRMGRTISIVPCMTSWRKNMWWRRA